MSLTNIYDKLDSLKDYPPEILENCEYQEPYLRKQDERSDRMIMEDQIDKLSSADGYRCEGEEKEDATDRALEHYNAVKPNFMLQVAQKTIKELYNRDVTSDDLNLDLDYLLNNEIFGIGYDTDDDEEEESLLDELDDEDDEEEYY